MRNLTYEKKYIIREMLNQVQYDGKFTAAMKTEP